MGSEFALKGVGQYNKNSLPLVHSRRYSFRERSAMQRFPKTLTVALFVLATGICLHAQDWAKARLDTSPRHHEYVALKHDNRTVQAFVVYPEVSTKAPVVILIHEIFGLSDWAKEMADELAGDGFIVIAPDLISGSGPNGGGSAE